MKLLKHPSTYALCLCIFAIFPCAILLVPAQPVLALGHEDAMNPVWDTGDAAKFVTNAGTQAFGFVEDTLFSGQLARGVTGMAKYTDNDALKAESGFRHFMSIPEQTFARIGAIINVDEVGFYQTSDLALAAANNRVYTYAKAGALTGGLTAAASGAFAGTTMIETYAASTAAGAVGGALTAAVVDATAGQ
jgi:hypothetical protein